MIYFLLRNTAEEKVKKYLNQLQYLVKFLHNFLTLKVGNYGPQSFIRLHINDVWTLLA